jgi:hypothetical protein
MTKLADNSDDSCAHWSPYYSFGMSACFTITSRSFIKFSFHVNVLVYLTFKKKLQFDVLNIKICIMARSKLCFQNL